MLESDMLIWNAWIVIGSMLKFRQDLDSSFGRLERCYVNTLKVHIKPNSVQLASF